MYTNSVVNDFVIVMNAILMGETFLLIVIFVCNEIMI